MDFTEDWFVNYDDLAKKEILSSSLHVKDSGWIRNSHHGGGVFNYFSHVTWR